MEKALALNPHADDLGQLGTTKRITADGADWLTLTHRRNRIRTGYTIAVETSTTLDSGSWSILPESADYNTTVVDPDSDGTGFVETVEQRVRIPTGDPRRFIRLRITE